MSDVDSAPASSDEEQAHIASDLESESENLRNIVSSPTQDLGSSAIPEDEEEEEDEEDEDEEDGSDEELESSEDMSTDTENDNEEESSDSEGDDEEEEEEDEEDTSMMRWDRAAE